jgi:hypothetical protein
MVNNLKHSVLLLFMIIWLSSLACNLFGKSTELAPVSLDYPTSTGSDVDPTVLAAPTVEDVPQNAIPDIGNLVVAYTNAQDLYLFSEGRSVRLTNSGDIFQPRISPDGQLIAFLKPVDDFHLEIWCIDRSGANERRLVSITDMDWIAGGVRDTNAVAINPFMDYQWIPGTKILAFTSQQIYQGPGLNLLNDLNLVNTESGVITPLFLSGWGGQFVFSPDGTQVALSQPDKILIANVDGSDYRTLLTYDPVTTYSEYRYYAIPVWAPDGSHLMVAIPPVDPLAVPANETELWRLNTEGIPAELLGSVIAVPFMEAPIQFSPDLKRIAFISGELDSNQREIHLATNDGGGDWLIAKAAPASFHSWSPDSRYFAYSVGTDEETWIASIVETPSALGPICLVPDL